MKILKQILLLVSALAIIGGQAHALSLTPATMPQMTGVETGVPHIIDEILDNYGIDLAGTELYKQNVGEASDSGFFSASYTTTFSNTGSDPSDALIDYVGGDFITDPGYLLVKDGNQDPAWYLFDISTWNGTDDIDLTGFWPGNGAISHVSIYGGDPVPEPATMLLFGIGLVGIAGLGRNRKKN